jgi:type I restriction enzyme R subunit
LKDPNKGKIITTIQKMYELLSNTKSFDRTKEIDFLRNSKIAIIFDECHRSLFGDQFKKISEFFVNSALLGFTGTPIFKSKSVDFNNVTKNIFNEELHTYGLSRALNDRVILPVEYEVNNLNKDEDESSVEISKNEMLLINKTKKYYDSLVKDVENRLMKPVQNKCFYAMLALSSIDALSYVAKVLRTKYKHIVFSADFSSGTDIIGEGETHEKFLDKANYKTEKEEIIKQFREDFQIEVDNEEDFTSKLLEVVKKNPKDKSFKQKHLNLILVVDKMLTGFDSE